MNKKELIKFWKSSASGPGSSNFLKESSTLRDRALFHNLAHISGKIEPIFVKVLSHMYPWTRKSSLNFGSNSDLESGSGVWIRIRTPDLHQILFGGGMQYLIALVYLLLTY